MKITFTDNKKHLNFCPLALTRPISEIRFGILTMSESWQTFFKSQSINCNLYYQTENYLSDKYPDSKEFDLLIAGNCKVSKTSMQAVLDLDSNSSLFVNGKWLAQKGASNLSEVKIEDKDTIWLEEIWDLFQQNQAAIKIDFDLLTNGRQSEPISDTNQLINPEKIFLEPGAKVECAILNATDGPIYIGNDAEVMEGAMIRGGFALGEHATVKMGAKIYGATTIGPECKVGGEISNCLLQGYSNKGHDGFIGNSVIGEWCNLGADTNSSNLKNNYGKVKIYSYQTKQLETTEHIFCGLLMGDHSKTGINTMLNTATTVGVSANVFGAEFPPKHIPSFSWGTADKFKFEKALEVATNMMKRRGINLSDNDIKILKHLYSL